MSYIFNRLERVATINGIRIYKYGVFKEHKVIKSYGKLRSYRRYATVFAENIQQAREIFYNVNI